MKKEYEKQLNYIAEGLSKLAFVNSVILFGSQVNGKAREDSDVDIAVITNSKINSNKEAKILGFSNERFDISLFDRLPLIVQFRVFRDGKIIFCRDKKYLHEIRYEVFRRYLDFSEFINKFYKRVIQNV